MEALQQAEVIIEKTRVHNKKVAPKGSIYFVARCRRPDKVHTIWFLAKSAILFKQDEADLKKHLTDQLLEMVEDAEKALEIKTENQPFYLSQVIDYIKRIWKKISRS